MTLTTLHTADGLALEAELREVPDAHAFAVLCHPHPQYGGTMRSIVTGALFEALPARGIACLRFNFRGVEHSEGAHSEGVDEPRDVEAALAAVGALDMPTVLVGWSFGADMALVVAGPRVAGWVAIAAPLRFRAEHDYADVARDPRPKLFVLAGNDEFRAPEEIVAETAEWQNRRVEVIPGASHFFVGRTERVVAATGDFIDALV